MSDQRTCTEELMSAGEECCICSYNFDEGQTGYRVGGKFIGVAADHVCSGCVEAIRGSSAASRMHDAAKAEIVDWKKAHAAAVCSITGKREELAVANDDVKRLEQRLEILTSHLNTACGRLDVFSALAKTFDDDFRSGR